MKTKLIAVMLLCGALAACAQQPRTQDPLQNTRKLVREGHATLYNNGAFEIPATTIHIIPPFPDAVDLALEMGGMRARQSFQESVKHARESVGLMQAGVEKSLQAASAVEGGTMQVVHGALKVASFGVDTLKTGPGVTSGMVSAAVTFAGETYDATRDAGGEFAQESVAAGKEMSKGATQASATVWSGTKAAADAGGVLAEGAVTSGKELSRDTTQASAAVWSGTQAAANAGGALAEDAVASGKALSHGATRASGAVWSGTQALAAGTSAASRAAAGEHFSAATRYIRGYAAVPEQLGQRAGAVKDSASLGNFVDAFQQSNQWRATQSGRMQDVVVGTARNYTKDVGDTFGAAKREIAQGNEETGYTFALLKSLGWVVQGIFWDATVKPIGTEAGAMLGYVAVNGLAYPALVTMKEGAAVANVAVQVTWNGAAAVYDVTAPTATAALAGVFGVVELGGGHALAVGEYAAGAVATAATYAGGQAAAGAVAGGGYVAGKTAQYGAYAAGAAATAATYAGGQAAAGAVAGGGYVAGKTVQYGAYAPGSVATAATYAGGQAAAGAVAGGGYLAGKTVQYVAAPLSAVGLAGSGGAMGVVTGGATSLAGAGLAATGAVAAAATYAGGQAAAGTVLAGGSVASVATGGALGTYELSKAVVVPVGHEVGAGVVLSYDTLSQLGAHAVLAVADASYVVLSLEGPNWVLYAVQGKLGKGEDLPPGAILDLKGMRQAGETLIAVPASAEEMKRVVDAVPGQLPAMRQPATSQPQSQPQMAHLEPAHSEPMPSQPVQPQPVQSQARP